MVYKSEEMVFHMLQVIAINSSGRKMYTYELIVEVKEILKNNNIDVYCFQMYLKLMVRQLWNY